MYTVHENKKTLELVVALKIPIFQIAYSSKNISYNTYKFLSLPLMRQLLLMTTLAQCALCMKRRKKR